MKDNLRDEQLSLAPRLGNILLTTEAANRTL